MVCITPFRTWTFALPESAGMFVQRTNCLEIYTCSFAWGLRPKNVNKYSVCIYIETEQSKSEVI